jgi:hypothetical protein
MTASAPGLLALAVLVTLLVDVFVALGVLVALAVFVDTLGFSHGAQKYFRDASKGANADPV